MKELPTQFGKGNLKSRKFWMSPEGDVYGIPYEWNHPIWAEKYLELSGKKSNYPQGELYKSRWIRLITGWDSYNNMILWYETNSRLLTVKEKQNLKNLAIELRVDDIEDRAGNRERVDERITLKSFFNFP